MHITLNGETKEITATTILELLREISAPKRGIAVECNGEIVPKSLHHETSIAENDQIEIVSFIGGG